MASLIIVIVFIIRHKHQYILLYIIIYIYIIISHIIIFCYEENILLLPWWIFWQFVHGGRGLWTRFHRDHLRSTREVIEQENNQLGKNTINVSKKQSIMQTINQLGNKTSIAKRTSVCQYPWIRTNISDFFSYKTVNR